jgi:hypothetical protein
MRVFENSKRFTLVASSSTLLAWLVDQEQAACIESLTNFEVRIRQENQDILVTSAAAHVRLLVIRLPERASAVCGGTATLPLYIWSLSSTMMPNPPLLDHGLSR